MSELKRYLVEFNGRQDGAIGSFARMQATVRAESIYAEHIIPALRKAGYETRGLVCRTCLDQ